METTAASRLFSRTLSRSSHIRHSPALRVHCRRIPNSRSRFQSTASSPTPASGSGSSYTSSLIAGVAGGSLVFLGGYAWYHFSGAKSLVNTAHQTKTYFDKAFKKTTEAAPEPNQALKWLRDTMQSYAAFIPGAKGYVDSAFNDLDKIHEKHGKEVDKIVQDAYKELKDVSKEGVSVESVSKAWDVLQTYMRKIGELASDAAGDLIDQHPELKEKVGGGLNQLKSMGEAYGPEAKKQVDDTWKEVQDVLKGGLGAGSIEKIRQLIQEKSDELKKFGDQAWQKGMEQAQPILDKQPQLKELIESNKEKLLQGQVNLSQLWEKVKSGNVDDVKSFISEQTQKASKAASSAGGEASDKVGSGIDQLLKMIPGGGDIMPKLQQIQELSQKHGKEAESLLKKTLDDLKGVLEKRADEAEKLSENAKDDAKKAGGK